jgi:hypothetical protein
VTSNGDRVQISQRNCSYRRNICDDLSLANALKNIHPVLGGFMYFSKNKWKRSRLLSLFLAGFFSSTAWSSSLNISCLHEGISSTLARFQGMLTLQLNSELQGNGNFRGLLVSAGAQEGNNSAAQPIFWDLVGRGRVHNPGELSNETAWSFELTPTGSVTRPAYLKVIAGTHSIGLSSRLLIEGREYQSYCKLNE